MPPLRALSPGEDRPAGYVFRLPPDTLRGSDWKMRPHFLLHRCRDGAGWGTLAHMTSQGDGTGGVTCELREMRGRMRLRSQRGSYVLASRLVPWPAVMLDRPSGAHGKHLATVRSCVGNALGIGSGLAPGGSGSLRGALVRIAPEVAAELGIQVASVVTQHAYSARRAFQVVVPIADGSRYEASDGDVALPNAARWHSALPSDWTGPPVALVPLTISLSHGGGSYQRQIDAVLPGELTSAELTAIEHALSARLGL